MYIQLYMVKSVPNVTEVESEVDEEFQPKDVYMTIFSYSQNTILATGNDMFDPPIG